MTEREEIKHFFEDKIQGKTWEELDPNLWEYYSDWHKDVFGYRPRDIICGEEK